MQNTSSLSIEYSVRLESLSLLRHAHAQEIPPFLDKNAKPKSLVGMYSIKYPFSSSQNCYKAKIKPFPTYQAIYPDPKLFMALE